MFEMLRSGVFLKVLFISWAITPLGMIFVGIVFESRVIPLWGDQSRAFNPGDIGLGFTLATGVYLYQQIPSDSFWVSGRMVSIGCIVAVLTCYVMRTWIDGENNYSRGALNSPTKLYHDFVLYLGFLWALVSACVPGILFGTSWGGDNLSCKLVGLVGFAVWVYGMYLDATDEESERKSRVRHTAFYQPIWKTRKLTFS
jgi:hypothetical protein